MPRLSKPPQGWDYQLYNPTTDINLLPSHVFKCVVILYILLLNCFLTALIFCVWQSEDNFVLLEESRGSLPSCWCLLHWGRHFSHPFWHQNLASFLARLTWALRRQRQAALLSSKSASPTEPPELHRQTEPSSFSLPHILRTSDFPGISRPPARPGCWDIQLPAWVATGFWKPVQ